MVDIDLSKQLHGRIVVESEGYAFYMQSHVKLDKETKGNSNRED
jgi:hypothetical protein